MGQRVDRPGARRADRQLQRHAELSEADEPRGSQQAGHQAALCNQHRLDPGACRRSAMGRALCNPRQRRLADAVHQADVQAPALWRHPRRRHRDRQDAVGPSAGRSAAQWAVQHPDAAAVRDRDSEQRRRGDDRKRPDLHRRCDRRPAARDRRAHRQGRVVGAATSGRPGDADGLSAGRPRISRDLRRRPPFHGDARRRQRDRLRAAELCSPFGCRCAAGTEALEAPPGAW